MALASTSESPGAPAAARVSHLWLASGLLFSGAAALALRKGAIQDYVAYQAEWQLVLAGKAPWGGSSENAYGPLFNLLALPYALHPLLPKVLFCASWAGTVAAAASACRRTPRTAWLIFFAGALCPFFWIEIAWFGHFDILAATLMLGACWLQLRGQSGRAGLCIAAAGALKFYPLILLAQLGLGRPPRWRLLAAGALGFAGLMMVGALLWGAGAELTPILYATHREPKTLSVYYFFTTPFWPWPSPWLQRSAPVLLLCAGGAAALLAATNHRDPIALAAIGLLAVLTAYKVGHPQFLIGLFFLLPWVVVRSGRSPRLWPPVLVYLSLVCLFNLLYVVGHWLKEPPWLVVRQLGSLPITAAAVWTLSALASASKRTARPAPI